VFNAVKWVTVCTSAQNWWGVTKISLPKQQRFVNDITEVDPGTIDEALDSSVLVGASGHEPLLEIEVEFQLHQFFIDFGASLSLVKLGVSQAEVQSINMAARGITGTKLKTLGIKTIAFRLRNKNLINTNF
jgi:hypothetical protein